MIKLDKATFRYTSDEDFVFQDVNFTLKAGEIISIVGKSGIGKSSLLKCIAGVLDLSDGAIYFEQQRVWGPNSKLIGGHPEIALVNQVFSLDRFFTVAENIKNQLLHLNQEARNEFTEELLEVFELQTIRHKKSKDISGGEQQRLSMACALAKEPQCLLLDEPFVHLDTYLSDKIGNYIKSLAKLRKMGVILVTHNGEEALSWSDRIILMKDGVMGNEYSSFDAYYHPKNWFEGNFFGPLNRVELEGEEFLFRPTAYHLENGQREIAVQWKRASFRGHYTANYFILANGQEIVLYADSILKDINKVYV